MTAKGINIWYGSSEMNGLGAALSNNTELAYLRRTVKKLYPIEFRGLIFADADSAYQYFRTNSVYRDMDLVTEILIAKLTQCSGLFNAIAHNGGVAWLEKCQHVVTGNERSVWEGVGRNSINAFEAVKRIQH